MNLLLREYLLSGDVAEAEHCLRELEVPHFHHELVYEVRVGVRRIPGRGCGGVLADPRCPQAVVMVLEGSGEGPVTMMVTLLEVLWKTGLVTLDQMNRVSAGWMGRGVGGQQPPGMTPLRVCPQRHRASSGCTRSWGTSAWTRRWRGSCWRSWCSSASTAASSPGRCGTPAPPGTAAGWGAGGHPSPPPHPALHPLLILLAGVGSAA